MKKVIIAIDGHSACGKSTLAKSLAKELKYVYIDSGAMYRAITFYALQNDYILEDGTVLKSQLLDDLNKINISFNYNSVTGKSDTFLNGINVEEEIRKMNVSKSVSAISKLKEVRTKLVDFQRKLGKHKGVVMDGRDIGTVVFPDAELKLWVTANIEVRTARRYKELLEKGQQISLDEVRDNVNFRDLQDSSRKESPLKRANDCKDIDNSTLSKNETLHLAVGYANDAIVSH